MAARTSTGSGLASVVLPTINDGDSVTITAGHDVVWDYDHTAMVAGTGLTGLVVNGSLKFKSDAVTCLAMANNVNITGTGTFGNPSSDPVQKPALGSAYRCRIVFKGTGRISNSGGVDLEGWTPELNHTTLSAPADLSATEIILTNDLGLQQGDEIVVGSGTEDGPTIEANKGVYTVQAYNAETKTVTLTSGLQTPRLEGDYVSWSSRAIQTERTPATAIPLTTTSSTSQFFRGIRMVGMASPNVPGAELESCTFKDGTSANAGVIGGRFMDCTGHNMQAMLTLSTGCTFIDCINMHGNGANGAFIYSSNINYLMRCISQNNVSMAKNAYGNFFSQCISKNSSVADLNTIYECMIYDGNLLSTVQVAGYNRNTVRKWVNNESHNHNDIEGNYRAWMKGGYIFLDNDNRLKFVIESDNPVFREYFIYLPGGRNVTFNVHGEKDFSGGTVKLQLIDPKFDPMIDDTCTPLQEVSMPDVQNEDASFGFKYRSLVTKYAILRLWIQNPIGNAWFTTPTMEDKFLQPKKTYLIC